MHFEPTAKWGTSLRTCQTEQATCFWHQLWQVSPYGTRTSTSWAERWFLKCGIWIEVWKLLAFRMLFHISLSATESVVSSHKIFSLRTKLPGGPSISQAIRWRCPGKWPSQRYANVPCYAQSIQLKTTGHETAPSMLLHNCYCRARFVPLSCKAGVDAKN